MNKLKPRPQKSESRGFENITGLERSRWCFAGPAIFGSIQDGKGRKIPKGKREAGSSSYIVWPDWAAFMRFYQNCREKFLAQHRTSKTPVCERLFLVWSTGGSIEQELKRIRFEHEEEQIRLYRLLEAEEAM